MLIASVILNLVLVLALVHTIRVGFRWMQTAELATETLKRAVEALQYIKAEVRAMRRSM